MDKINLAYAAVNARKFSYSPYSHFKTGAALLTKSGKVYTGANIENAAYSPTICAERTAVAKAVSEGNRDFTAIAVCGSGSGYCYPCGVCLQVMLEFVCADEFVVLACKENGEFTEHKLSELLPLGFKLIFGTQKSPTEYDSAGLMREELS